MGASGWPLEASTNEAGSQHTQRRARGAMSRLKDGNPLEAPQRPILQQTLVSSSDCGVVGLHGVASLRRPSRRPLKLCL